MVDFSSLSGLRGLRPLLVASRFVHWRWTPLLERICRILQSEGIPILQVGECPPEDATAGTVLEHGPGIARVHVPTSANWRRNPLRYLRSRRRFRACLDEIVETVRPRAVIFENADMAGVVLDLALRRPDLPIVYWGTELSCRFVQAPFRRHERLIAPRLTGLVMNNPDRVSVLKKRIGRDIPALVIPNTETRLPEEKTFEGAPLREMFKRHNPEVDTIFLYSGIVSHKQGILDVVRALRLLSPNVGFAFADSVGNPAYIERIAKTAGQLGLDRRIIHPPWTPFDRLAEVTASADVGVALLRVNDLNTKYCASSKLYRYLCVGLPVLGASLPAIADVIEPEGLGVTCDVESVEDIARAMRVLANPEKRACMARRAKRVFDERLCLEVEWRKHRKTLLEWISGGRAQFREMTVRERDPE